MKTVTITLDRDGSMKVEAHGMKGPSCKEKTDWINQRYGNPESEEFKSSYYEEETESTKVVQGLPSGHCG